MAAAAAIHGATDDSFVWERDTKPAIDAESLLGNAVAFFDPPFYPNIPSILMTGNGCERGSADVDMGNTSASSPSPSSSTSASSSDSTINIGSNTAADLKSPTGAADPVNSTNTLPASSLSPLAIDEKGSSGMGTDGSWMLTFHQFRAESPSQTADASSPHPSARNCQTHISVGRGPPGWQVAIKTVTVRGYASLAPGSVLTATGTAATFILTGGSDSATPVRTTRTATLINDRSEDMAGQVTISLNFGTAGPWSSCMDGVATSSGILSINFRVAVSTGGVNATTTVASAGETGGGSSTAGRHGTNSGAAIFGGPVAANGTVTERLKWIWRRCDSSALGADHGASTSMTAAGSQATEEPAMPSDTPMESKAG